MNAKTQNFTLSAFDGDQDFALQILESSPDCVKIIDLEARLIYMSSCGQRLLGIKKIDKVLNQCWFDFWPDFESGLAREAFARAKAGGVGEFEGYYTTEDGEGKWWNVRVSPIRNKDQALDRFLVLSRDITLLKKHEQRLEKVTELLKKSNKELEQFAVFASHDLQEPLRQIKTLIGLLKMNDGGQEEAEKIMEYVIQAASRAEQLVKDLLEYSRMHKQGDPEEPVSAESVLEEVVDTLRLSIQDAEASVTFDFQATVKAHRSLLSRVFQNLIQNAIKYRSREKPVIRIEASQKDKEWIFSVRDNGIGIAPENQEKVFMFLQRLPSTSGRQGTGIGLTICQKIVEAHGGRIWVESEPGKGSTFYFSLPAF